MHQGVVVSFTPDVRASPTEVRIAIMHNSTEQIVVGLGLQPGNYAQMCAHLLSDNTQWDLDAIFMTVWRSEDINRFEETSARIPDLAVEDNLILNEIYREPLFSDESLDTLEDAEYAFDGASEKIAVHEFYMLPQSVDRVHKVVSQVWTGACYGYAHDYFHHRAIIVACRQNFSKEHFD